MSISLAPISQKSKLQTVSSNKMRRAKRVQSDLTNYYTETEVRATAEFIKLPYINLYGFPIDTTHLSFLEKSVTEQLQLGVFAIRNKEIDLATPVPGFVGQEELVEKLKSQNYHPVVFLCSQLSFDRLVSRYDYLVKVADIKDGINLTEQKFASQNSLQSLEKQIAKLSISDAVETILLTAIQNKASDIHFEPEKEDYLIRLRLDGVLHNFAKLPMDRVKPIESRLKIISGLKLNVDNIPQDGRFSFKVRERDIDVRVSMLPSNYGYSIVMRILGTEDVALDLTQLGFSGLAKERVDNAINKPQGLILTTGPTGSGKTTTLYTFLKNLNNGENKIITLEDPIEYKLAGVSQTQINKEAGYTFAGGLRSILRQDPDVVMVGEIRDSETAEIAIQASLTGHQVLSTIHTNDAAGAIPRLMEMNIKGFLLADSLAAVIGQRLVRKLCPFCQVDYTPDEKEMKVINDEISKLPDKSIVPTSFNFKISKGCEKCNNLGYKGRLGVYEVMTITDGLRTLISKQFPSIVDVREIAKREGMVTMLQDGILKVCTGLTDIKEVLKNVA